MKIDEDMNDVTVIIPTYSRVDSTVRAVASALRQTVKPKSIFVIDDGSPNEIFENLRKSIDETKVNLIKSTRSCHPGIARNVGIFLATTKWIAFLDSDDFWVENNLEQQLKFAKENSARAISSNAFINENQPEIGLHKKFPRRISTEMLIRRNFIINSSVLIERDLLFSVGGVSSEYSVRGIEDYTTWLKVSKLADWYALNENLVYYNADSLDSIRRTHSSNYFTQVGAWLNFASWVRDKSGSKQLTIRLLLRILGKIIGKVT